MAKQDDKVSRLYEERRVYPRSQPHDGKNPSPHRAANVAEGHYEHQRPQFPEDAHGHGYDNDVRKTSWLQNGDATTKPSFDKGNAWRKDMRDQIKDRPVDHNRHWSEFEVTGKHGTTHVQGAYDHKLSKKSVPGYEKKLELGGDNSMPKHTKWKQG